MAIKNGQCLIFLLAFAIIGMLTLLVTDDQQHHNVHQLEKEAQQVEHVIERVLHLEERPPNENTAISDHQGSEFDSNTRSDDTSERNGAIQELPPPPAHGEVQRNMTEFVRMMASTFRNLPQNDKNPIDIWGKYYDLAEKMLVPMDLKWRGGTMYPVRDDDSVFVSIGSYRDELCPPTLIDMFDKAARPERLYVGLVQQNCLSGCRTGVLDHQGTVKDQEGPDVDCYREFCASPQGREACAAGRVRHFFINETESLGPAQARYFAAKLWEGESWFFQIDSHCTFAEGWEQELIDEYHACPTTNPKRVLTHYPPAPGGDAWKKRVGMRICDPLFATSDIESQIVRLNAAQFYDREMTTPRFAPFIAAGMFFTHGSFLGDIPFDPLMPWIFMGEEILLSLRFWTNGWDIFSPKKNVLTHYYVRRHKPKFWETVGRVFGKPGIHNPIQLKVMDRVKNILGYPETHDDIVYPPTLLAHKDLYGVGNKRRMDHFYSMVGIDTQTKRVQIPQWCHKGIPPPQVE